MTGRGQRTRARRLTGHSSSKEEAIAGAFGLASRCGYSTRLSCWYRKPDEVRAKGPGNREQWGIGSALRPGCAYSNIVCPLPSFGLGRNLPARRSLLLLELVACLFKGRLHALVLDSEGSKLFTTCLELLPSDCESWTDVLKLILESLITSCLLKVSAIFPPFYCREYIIYRVTSFLPHF